MSVFVIGGGALESEDLRLAAVQDLVAWSHNLLLAHGAARSNQHSLRRMKYNMQHSPELQETCRHLLLLLFLIGG